MVRPVSVVVNTYNRADALRKALGSLRQLDYPCFEVVVVNGPSSDRTGDVLAEFADQVKVVRCEDRNLSRSRNLGIANASGEIVAFIDDDAYPDPAWLDDLVAGFDDDEVAAVGGPVYNHTGTAFQARYSVATRFGEAWVDEELNPTEYLARPRGRTFPYTIGTNSAFLRRRLVEIGGFDEQFDYYLDETDVCCRLLDRGHLVKLVDRGFVYHKFLASDVRTPNRGIRNRYSIIRNIVYFALRHAVPVSSFYEVCQSLVATMERNRADYRWSIEAGYLTEADYEQYLQDIPRAFDAGLEAWRTGPRTRAADWFAGVETRFLPMPVLRPAADKLHVCLVAFGYRSRGLDGSGRSVDALATGLAAGGHVVHVLTRSSAHSTVDLESGVWVHRVAPRGHESLVDELRKIHDRRRVDVVQLPRHGAEQIVKMLPGDLLTVAGVPREAVRAPAGARLERNEERDAGTNMVENITRYYRRLLGARPDGTPVEETEDLEVIAAPRGPDGDDAAAPDATPAEVPAPAAAVPEDGDAGGGSFGERVPENIRRLAFSRAWFHQVDLGHGIVSPGIDDSPAKLQRLGLPASFRGSSVIDVGAYDGFFSFEAERRGADRVVAADHFCWTLDGMCDGRGFDIAHWALRSRVEKRLIKVEDLSPETVGTFDYVLFLGVLYHSQDPLRYLRNVHSICARTAIVETHVDGIDYDRPMMVFYPGAILNRDPSNFWGPNLACVQEMLLEVGFKRAELLGHYGDRAVFHAHR